MRIRHAVLAAAIACLVIAQPALAADRKPEPRKPAAEPRTPRVVFVVRHGERADKGELRDPDLSAAGRARADLLASMLAHAGVTNLFATEFKRTQETLAPLAAKSGVRVEIVQADKTAALAKLLLSLPPGSVAVVAGHANTVPEVVQKLVATGGSGSAAPALVESDYDRMFEVILPPPGGASRLMQPQVLEIRYGEP